MISSSGPTSTGRTEILARRASVRAAPGGSGRTVVVVSPPLPARAVRGDLADEPGEDLVLRADLDGAHRDLRPPRERAGVALLLGQDDRDDVSPAARPGRAAGAV